MSKEDKQSTMAKSASGTGVIVGRFDYSIDPKFRFTVPSEWRDAMGNPAYVYVMPDRSQRCLNLIAPQEMDVRLAKLREQALFDPKYSEALQVIGANCEQLMFDKQGRIRVCDRFLQFAGLKKKISMIGAVRMGKLWSPDAVAPESSVAQNDLGAAMDAVSF